MRIKMRVRNWKKIIMKIILRKKYVNYDDIQYDIYGEHYYENYDGNYERILMWRSEIMGTFEGQNIKKTQM